MLIENLFSDAFRQAFDGLTPDDINRIFGVTDSAKPVCDGSCKCKVSYETSDSNEDVITKKIAVPGLSKNDIEVYYDDGFLYVKSNTASEFMESVIDKKYKIGPEIDVDSINVKVDNGIITIEMNKIKTEKKQIRIL